MAQTRALERATSRAGRARWRADAALRMARSYRLPRDSQQRSYEYYEARDRDLQTATQARWTVAKLDQVAPAFQCNATHQGIGAQDRRRPTVDGRFPPREVRIR